VAKRKRKTANNNVQTFVIFIWCFYSLDSSSGGLETELQITGRHEYWLLIRFFFGARSTFWSRNTKNNYWIRYSRKIKTANQASRKYPSTALGNGTNKERESESLTFSLFPFSSISRHSPLPKPLGEAKWRFILRSDTLPVVPAAHECWSQTLGWLYPH